MVEDELVTVPQEAGWNLLEKLDEAGLGISVAYWDYRQEEQEWQLVLSTDKVMEEGPLYVVRKIQDILAKMPESEKGDLSLNDLIVVNPHLLEIENLRWRKGEVVINRGRSVRRTSLSRSEPFIYRLK